MNPIPPPNVDSTTKVPVPSALDTRLKRLRLPTIRAMAQSLSEQASKEHWTYLRYLDELMRLECETRNANRIRRRLKESELEPSKTWDQVQWGRLPIAVRQRMDQLRSGEFLEQATNLLIFGRPGSGKTMLLNALGDALVHAGHTVCMAPCTQWVQHLLLAKKELRLPQLMSKLAKFSALIIDDIGYVQQSREEMEVLFTLIANRYERSSILLSSNLPFSKWESIFKDPMTTAAAIDRLVHHSVILELNVPSFRLEHASIAKTSEQPPVSP
jgi:DNA replication protein DnaC